MIGRRAAPVKVKEQPRPARGEWVLHVLVLVLVVVLVL
jgi:hypothetical protein